MPCEAADVPRDMMACCFSWGTTLSEVREQITLGEASKITYGHTLKIVLQTKLSLLFLSVPLCLSLIVSLLPSLSLFSLTHTDINMTEEQDL